MLDVFDRALGSVAARRVLDVATGDGGFVQILIDRLCSYTEIVGVDVSRRAAGALSWIFDRP